MPNVYVNVSSPHVAARLFEHFDVLAGLLMENTGQVFGLHSSHVSVSLVAAVTSVNASPVQIVGMASYSPTRGMLLEEWAVALAAGWRQFYLGYLSEEGPMPAEVWPTMPSAYWMKVDIESIPEVTS